MIPDISLAHVQINLSAVQPILFRPDKGSAFRGAFGRHFRDTICVNRDQQCTDCMIRFKCPYAFLFESFNQGMVTEKKTEKVPHPFILGPAEPDKKEFQPGDHLTLSLVLVGPAIDLLGYFIFVFRQIGSGRGIGLSRSRECGRFVVESVTDSFNSDRLLYKDGKWYSETVRRSARDITGQPADACRRIRIEFLSRTRLEYFSPEHGRNNVVGLAHCPLPSFDLFWDRLYQRLRLLSAHYGRQTLPNAMSYEPIHLTGQKLFYQEDVRFSSRQKGLVPYSGFKGHIEAEGDCREYLPWLRLGQHLHIGKWTSMGFGQYRLQEYH